ncbi:MAG TPA: GEVED domain-containing protein, partial [Bacteroidia bacterium]|nr:GEVED domain-containing protein [Bacteroidia bacterium]
MSAMLWTTSAQAQLAIKYPLTISSGTYSSISGSGAPVAIIGDDMAVNITGLTGFTVNGTTYTNARMCSNGWLALYGASVPTTTGTYAPLSTAITNGAVIFAPFGRDLNSQSGTGAYWQTIGNELIFEWVNYIRYAQTGESLNFQIRLNTVTGEIKFVYGTMTALTGSTYPQVGWKTNGTVASNWATDVNNLMIDNVGSPNTCNWSNAVTGNANTSTMYFNSANATIKPNSGLTYTWTKPVATDPEPVRTHAAVSGITTNNATLNWTAPANATQYNVQYRTVGSCSWTNWSGNPVGTNSVTLTGLTSSTTYQVRVQASNGSTNAIYSHIPNLAGTGNGYVAAGTFTTVASCVAPTAPVGSPTTATTANISWTAASPVPSNGYEYAVTTSAVPPVSGTAFAGTSTSVSGLTPATTYYLHVRSYCGGSDYSAWVTSASFNTPCNAIATLPWTEGFESAVIPAYPSTCWYEDPSSGDWITTNNSSSSNDADARTGAQFLRDAYSATNEFIWTPGFSLTAGQSVDFSFWWAGDNYSGWTGDVFYNTAQTGTGATQMGTSFVTSGTTTTKTYAKQTRTLVAPATGTYYFAIRVNATGGPWYLSFDDFNVENTPSCVAPTALVGTPTTATTANISWTAASPVPSNGYEYAVTTSATPPGSGTAFAGTSTSVSGLTPSTTYYLHVRSYCGGSSYSTWASSASFMTGQIPATLPYSNSFGSNDFAFVNGSQTNQWAYGSATGNPANAIYVSNDNGTSNAYTISSLSVVQAFRDIAIPNGTTLTNFSFNWIANGESCCDYLRVWLVPTSYNPTAGTQITAGAGRIQIGSNMNVQSAWQTYTNNTLDLSSFAGQTMRLVFEWKNDGSIGTQPPAAIDNISLAQVASCSGTPAPGNTQSNLPSACSAQSFTLSMSNTINDIGITYDWQSSPDGITWTSTGGTNATYTTTQTAATYYQCVVTCTNSGMSATSTPVQVTMSPFYNCYCTTNLHTSSSPCITQVDFNTISNNTAGAGCALPAYSYQAATTTVLKGSSYTFTRTTTSTGVWTGVWIDYDQSGTFDASEYTEVSSTSTGALTNSVTITIPVTALDGNTGMRIRQRTVDMLATDACTQGFGSGETEDYTVDIQTPVGCSGTPSATIGGAPANVCAGVPFTLTAGPTGLAGFTYQFQNSTDGGLTWNNMGIADVFNNYIVSNQTVTTMYQVIVTCTNSGLSNTSTAVTVTQNSPTACYCTPTTVNGFTYYITNFTTTGGITNINNSSVGGGPYQNFSGSASASANPGATINYSISVTSGTYGRAIWIDLNEDGVFQATEQLVTSSSFLSSPLTGSFIIPNGTTAGTKRMRVLASWSYSGPTDPCNISGNGEYEDYSFEVVALPSCTGTPAATISGPANICAGIGFNLTAGPTGVDGLTYQFQNSTDGGITWNNLGSAGINNIYAITSQSVTTQYQVIVYCSYSGLNATSTPITVTQNLPSACYCTPTTGGGLTYYISNFTTTGGTTNINQSSGGSSTGYDDHSATVSGEFEPGSTINFTMTIAGSSNFGHAIWIDFNADGTFQATEQIVTSNSYLYSPITGSFTIPLNATTGVRRMRILTSFTPSNPTNPCTNSGQGEYEDYSINITPPVCISAPSSPANAGSACADVITNTVLL